MFWAPCSSGGRGVGGWGWGVVGLCLPHMCTCKCMHTQAHVVNMIISCKWLPPLGESLGIPYDVICTCVCVHVCACACMCKCVGAPSHHPPATYTHLPIPRGTPGINQNSIALELIEIFRFHLKIWNLWRLPHPWVGVLLGGWVGGLMGGVRSND